MRVSGFKSKYSIVDVDNWDHNKKKHIEIIKSFLEKEDILLFQYFKADPYYWEPEFIQEQKDSDYELFVNNYYGFHIESTKEQALKDIEHILQECDDLDNKDNLIQRFLQQELGLSESVLDKIKEIIYIAVNTEENPDLKKFVTDRQYISDNRLIKFKNEVAFYTEPKVSITWFETKTDEDIKTAIDFLSFYTCAIVKKGETLDEFRYILKFNETVADYNIDVYEKNKGDFKVKVYPKIQELCKEYEFDRNELKRPRYFI